MHLYGPLSLSVVRRPVSCICGCKPIEITDTNSEWSELAVTVNRLNENPKALFICGANFDDDLALDLQPQTTDHTR